MIELTFCKVKSLPRPFLSHANLPLLLRAMVLDGLITSRDASHALQSSAIVDRDNITLELLESIAPLEVYRVFRWLRGFCCESREYSDEIALNAIIPYTSSAIALSESKGAREGVKVKIPKQASQSLIAAVDRIVSFLGVPLEIERCDEPLALQVWSPPPVIDLISHALGDAATVGKDVLAEVLGSGGAMVSRALLDLLGSERRFALKLLVAFDFLRPYVAGGGLVFALTQKALEVLF